MKIVRKDNSIGKFPFPSRRKVSLENDSYFHFQLTQFNIKRLHVISTILLAITLALAITNIVTHYFSKTDEPYLKFYLIPYGLLAIINLYVFIRFRSKNIKVTTDLAYYKKLDKIIAIYVFLVIFLGMSISLLDQIYYQHVIIYTATVTVCTTLFLLRTRFIIVPITISMIIVFLSLIIMHGYSDLTFFQLQLLLIIIPIMLIVSRSSYNHFIQEYNAYKELQETTLQARDLAEQLAFKNKELEYVSMIDELTQIANRHGYHHYLHLLEDEQKPFSLTVMMMDIDYFKNYNDYYGHTAGDEVLKIVAKILQQVCEQNGAFVARWGGEEFLIIVKNKSPNEIIHIYDAIIHNIKLRKISHPNSKAADYLSLSVGAYQDDLHSIDQLHHYIIEADSVLYEVKETKRNGFKFVKHGQVLYEKLNH